MKRRGDAKSNVLKRDIASEVFLMFMTYVIWHRSYGIGHMASLGGGEVPGTAMAGSEGSDAQ